MVLSFQGFKWNEAIAESNLSFSLVGITKSFIEIYPADLIDQKQDSWNVKHVQISNSKVSENRIQYFQ